VWILYACSSQNRHFPQQPFGGRAVHSVDMFRSTSDARMLNQSRSVLAVLTACVLSIDASSIGAQPSQPVTASAQDRQTAFADEGARQLLTRARIARASQDSALQQYEAQTNVRYTYGLGLRSVGFERLLMRSDQVARVRWSRNDGAVIEPLGERNVAPVGMVSLALTAPIPYWVGRDALWMPVEEFTPGERLNHPLGIDAESHYQYASGGSLNIKLPNGQAIHLQELRVTPRIPNWRSIVGTFWFDSASGNLVRAAYRLGADIDLWELESEADRRRVAAEWSKVANDTAAINSGMQSSAVLREQKSLWERTAGKIVNKAIESFAEGSLQPLGMRFSGITIEYGLYNERFWLPRLRTADVEIMGGSARFPARIEERFQYPKIVASTDSSVRIAAEVVDSNTIVTSTPRTFPNFRSAQASDSLAQSFEQKAASARRSAEDARKKGDSRAMKAFLDQARDYEQYRAQALLQRDQCSTDSTYFAGTTVQTAGSLRVSYRLKCDPSNMRNAPELGPEGETPDNLFESSVAEDLLKSLDMSLQPGWFVQKPKLLAGLSMLRYNRIEGLSLGASSTMNLGRGYSARGEIRYGFGDEKVNGEFAVARSSGSVTRKLRAYHRLAVANDGFGAPLSLGASVGNLLFGRDEGFYFRSHGLEFEQTSEARTGIGGARFKWRVFAESQRSAGVFPNTQGSLANRWGSVLFNENIAASALTAAGLSGEMSQTWGIDPRKFRFTFRPRIEAAVINGEDAATSKNQTSGYGRLILDGTLSRSFGLLAGSVTGAVGASAGEVPLQRSFFAGGLYSVRGQFARASGTGRVGDSFWLTRTELGLPGAPLLRPALFFDAGWAGARADLLNRSKPLTGAGAGLSILDGLVRFDAARGIWPEKRWRYSLYLGARF
jgi:hypothetical protein